MNTTVSPSQIIFPVMSVSKVTFIGVSLETTVNVVLTVQLFEFSAITVIISSFLTNKLLVEVVVETVATKKEEEEVCAEIPLIK